MPFKCCLLSAFIKPGALSNLIWLSQLGVSCKCLWQLDHTPLHSFVIYSAKAVMIYWYFYVFVVAESSEWICIQRQTDDHTIWSQSFSCQAKLDRLVMNRSCLYYATHGSWFNYSFYIIFLDIDLNQQIWEYRICYDSCLHAGIRILWL